MAGIRPSDYEQRLFMTYEEFLVWGEESWQMEWVNGETIVFVPPTDRHQAVVGFLLTLIAGFVDLHELGVVIHAPFEMRARPGGPAREPDLLFIAREHRDRLIPERLAGPADLVIEIISDSSLHRDRVEKFYEYQAVGIREYWLFDPRPGKERVDFWRLNGQGKYDPVLPDADGRYHAATLSGFWFRPDWLWQNPLPNVVTTLATIAPQAFRRVLPATEQEHREGKELAS